MPKKPITSVGVAPPCLPRSRLPTDQRSVKQHTRATAGGLTQQGFFNAPRGKTWKTRPITLSVLGFAGLNPTYILKTLLGCAIGLLNWNILSSPIQPVLAEPFPLPIPALNASCAEPNLQKQTEPLPEVTPSSEIDAIALIAHLQRLNAQLYGAYWCPHSRAQRALFNDGNLGDGNLGDRLVAAEIYVECAKGGPLPATPWRCDRQHIQEYPTWRIGDEDYGGMLSLAELAEISGFNKPD
ncbi:MAG: hypothetical protein AAGG51_27625 [Cyanobacteria bacterium P01_G01_bin.54]